MINLKRESDIATLQCQFAKIGVNKNSMRGHATLQIRLFAFYEH